MRIARVATGATDVQPRRPYYPSPCLPGSFYPMTAASGGSYGPYDFPSAQLNNYAAAFARPSPPGRCSAGPRVR